MGGRPGRDLRLASRLAWLLATAPEAEVRDGAAAVHLAEDVCERTGQRLPKALGVLAVADVGAGSFDRSVEMARRAQELARPDLFPPSLRAPGALRGGEAVR